MPRNRKHFHPSRRYQRTWWLCLPVAVSLAVRVIGAVLLYHLLSRNGEFHSPWLDVNPNLIPSKWGVIPTEWLWVFHTNDSLHITVVAMLGYWHPMYVFLPGFPIFIRFAGLMLGDYWVGAFLVAQFFALASIVMFQLLAE